MVLSDTPPRGEHGFSLVESLIAITVLGIIVTAMVGGMATSITMSSLHRKEASANALMVSAAEVVKHLPYTNCALVYSTAAVPPRSGWSIDTKVQYWDPASNVFDSTCRDYVPGLFPMQLVTILVTATGTAVTRCPVYKDPGLLLAPTSTSCVAVIKRKP